VSLSGSVKDLPLFEILQVVAFTQRTGYLTVETPEGDAALVFREGRVVSGYIWDVPPLGPEIADLPPVAREDAIRGRIRSNIERLARLREGRFGFSVAEEAPSRIGNRDLAAETLEDGINPEGLMLDLARQLDEDRRESSAALEASLAVPPVEGDDEHLLEELVLDETPGGPPVLLVDDEPDVLRLVREPLATAGFAVVEATDTAGGRREVGRLAERGEPFVVVTDLGLPSLGGSNFRGGLEIVEFAAALEKRPGILLMAETADERLRNKARRLGVSILALKPGLAKLDPLQYEADLRAFGRKLARDLVPRLQRRAAPPPPPEERPAPPPAVSLPSEAARRATLLGARSELASHPEPDLVAFLLLRAARAFLPRAVLFLVKDDSLRGLAGFGPTRAGTSLDVLARDLSVSLDEASPFADAVAPGHFWTGSPPANGPTHRLLRDIGSLNVGAATVIPVRAQQATIAVLYGDAPSGQSLPALEPLAEFAEQAGRALDEAFLARRSAAVPA
jgi:CheY-like chemotaxis protein